METNKINHATPSTKTINDRILAGIVTPMFNLLPVDMRHCIAAGCDMTWAIDDGVLLVCPTNPVVLIQISDRIFLYEEQLGFDAFKATTFQYKGE